MTVAITFIMEGFIFYENESFFYRAILYQPPFFLLPFLGALYLLNKWVWNTTIFQQKLVIFNEKKSKKPHQQ